MPNRRITPAECREAAFHEVADQQVSAAENSQSDFYVDLLMKEWQMERQTTRLANCVRDVLRELIAESQLVLRRERKLEVVVLPEEYPAVWAHFPIREKRTSFAHPTKPATEIALALSVKHFDELPEELLKNELRIAFGHILLYLSNVYNGTNRRNTRRDAMKEWQRWAITSYVPWNSRADVKAKKAGK
jgi:hypothetical protein